MKVFVLQHVHEHSPDNKDVKLIGVYSTEDQAKAAIERVVGVSGFREAPDGFGIDGYELDEDHWTEGYVAVPDTTFRERAMYQEKRPTCVTVIGWAWAILGVLMCVAAVMAFFGWCFILTDISNTHTRNQQNAPVMFWAFPLAFVGQIVVASLGIVAGINFLRLRSWSRGVLEVLTWLLLIFDVGFGLFWVAGWIVITSRDSPLAFSIMGSVIGTVSIVIYGIPLGFMLKYLRGDTVRNAMHEGAQPSDKGEP